MPKNWYEHGTWNAQCDVCDIKRKAHQLIERWDGLMVCKPSLKKGCWEPRHPLEYVQPPRTELGLPWTRPEATDTEVASGNGLSTGVPELNIEAMGFVYLDRGQFESARENFTIIKAITQGPLTIPSGITITILGTLQVNVAGVITSYGPGTYTSFITATASVSATANAAEPATNGEFTITLDKVNESGQDIIISYAVSGTATAGVDYSALSGTATIEQNADSVTIAVEVIDDPDVEDDETVILTLTAADYDGVTIDITPATVTITSDDVATDLEGSFSAGRSVGPPNIVGFAEGSVGSLVDGAILDGTLGNAYTIYFPDPIQNTFTVTGCSENWTGQIASVTVNGVTQLVANASEETFGGGIYNVVWDNGISAGFSAWFADTDPGASTITVTLVLN
jgi:hypothetical protein